MRFSIPSHQEDATVDSPTEAGPRRIPSVLRRTFTRRKTNEFLRDDGDTSTNTTSPTIETRNGRANSTSSTATEPPTPSKARRSRASHGTLAILKSLNQPPSPEDKPVKEQPIEFDWDAEKYSEMFIKDALLLQNNNPSFDIKNYSMEDWVSDLLKASSRQQWEMRDEEVVAWFEKLEEVRKIFFYKDPIMSHGSYIGAHSNDYVSYPLSYDAVTLQNDRHSHELLKRIYYGLPSIHGLQFSAKPPKVVLDLGCGDGSWIIDSAQCWNNTRFYGLDLQRFYPTHETLVENYGEEFAKNIKFVSSNFLSQKLPFLDGVFQMVRMANLKWCIPKNKWDDVLLEVRRVTARGGLIEIIDDDFVTHTSPDNSLTDKALGSCGAVESQFAEVLHARNLVLETNQLMLEKLEQIFSVFHQDVLPVAISPKMGVRPPPKTGEGVEFGRRIRSASTKIMRKFSSAKSFTSIKSPTTVESSAYIVSPTFVESPTEIEPSTRPRSGSESSQSSQYSQSTARSVFESTPGTSFEEHSNEEGKEFHENEDNEDLTPTPPPQPPPLPLRPRPRPPSRPIPPRPQPLGLVVLDRFLPCTPDEILAHATKNMQSVLSARETARSYLLSNDPARASLELTRDHGVYQEMLAQYRKATQEFEDLYWTYETTMSDRLNINIPQCGIDMFETDDMGWSTEADQTSDPPRPLSTVGHIHKGDFYWDGDQDDIAQQLSANGLDKLVRVIRVYTVWK